MDEYDRALAVDLWNQDPIEWELHPRRWDVQRVYFVRYRRMGIPLTVPLEFAGIGNAGEEVSLELDQWGDVITINDHSHMVDAMAYAFGNISGPAPKQHDCILCPKTFKKAKQLRQHTRTKHPSLSPPQRSLIAKQMLQRAFMNLPTRFDAITFQPVQNVAWKWG